MDFNPNEFLEKNRKEIERLVKETENIPEFNSLEPTDEDIQEWLYGQYGPVKW